MVPPSLSKRSLPFLLTASMFLFVTPGRALQDSETRNDRRVGEINVELEMELEEALGALRDVAESVGEAFERLAGYEAIMRCPDGSDLVRERAWDGSLLRAVPVRSLEEDLLSQCALPEGLAGADAEWWVSPTEQQFACSGPFGKEMSRWGEDYEFLQEACAIHDICYRSSMDKTSCDSLFAENMRTLCRNPGLGDWLTSGLCGLAVEITEELFDHLDFRRSYEDGQAQLGGRIGV